MFKGKFERATRWLMLSLAMLMMGLAVMSPAQAGAITDYGENKVLDAVVRGQALGAPANWFIGLDTGACTDSGGTEVSTSGTGYTRVTVTASLTAWAGSQSAGSTVASSGTSGTTSNNATITFPTPTTTWGTVVSVRWWDAASGGNAWICTALTTSKTINAGDTITFPAGTLTFQVDN